MVTFILTDFSAVNKRLGELWALVSNTQKYVSILLYIDGEDWMLQLDIIGILSLR